MTRFNANETPYKPDANRYVFHLRNGLALWVVQSSFNTTFKNNHIW